MSSTMRGEDTNYDLTTVEKDKREKELRAEARKLLLVGKKKKRDSLLNQANEISWRKSKRADHH
ncbi:MAG: hypothetical protein BWK80_59620 [Desulfobacteraceae bacterium IS3]|nr:MAG: hypothetical protein BWK80_59620 [Desulfobacteraceae bacterium IS3]